MLDRAEIRTGGLVTNVRRLQCKAGHRFVRFALRDVDGAVDCIAFGRAIASVADLADGDFVNVAGLLDVYEGRITLVVKERE